MKKIFEKYKVLFLVFSVLLISSVVLAVVLVNRNEEAPSHAGGNKVPTVKGETEVIFSFDTYKEIIGTEPSLYNDFGETKFNRDEAFITEGSGSWMVRPQGDYGIPNRYPYVRMKCYDSSFKTNDFSDYDQILMDVYNASEEEITIKWLFKSGALMNDNNVDAEEVIYTLEPGKWTTCEYNLVDAMYGVLNDLSDMRYMTIRFMTQKESKDDVVPTLYFDNLRGHLMEGEREEIELKGSFEKGISFEEASERAYFYNNNSWLPNNNVLSRVAYEETTVKPHDFMGEYVLKGDATSSAYPGTTVIFDKTYTAGKFLSFMMYIEVDEALVEETGFSSWAVQSHGNIVKRAGGAFNEWQQVDIQLKEDCDTLWFFPQLCLSGEAGVFGETPVTIYMDCFQIVDEVTDMVVYNFDFEKGITFEKEEEKYAIKGSSGSDEGKYSGQWSQSVISLKREQFDGSYTMKGKTKNQYPEIFVPFGKTYPAGTTFTFRYYIEGTATDTEAYKVTMRGYPGGEKANVGYNISARKFNRWYETTFTFTEAHDRVSIFMELAGTSAIKDGKTVNIYFDDFYINKSNASSIKKFDFEKGITFENESEEEAIVGSTGDDTSRFKGQWSQTILSLSRVEFDGSYTMRGKTNCAYPEAFIELGKTYPEGTTFTFRYYVKGDVGEGDTYQVSLRGYPEGETKETRYTISGRKFGRWYESTITFTKAHDRISVFMEFTKAAVGDGKSVEIYYDDLYINKEITSSVTVFDFEKGITFEDEKEEEAIIGSTGENTDRFTGQWSQNVLNLFRTEFDGSYTMKGKTKCQYPTFFAELGKTYPAGTTFTFRYYVAGEVNETETYKVYAVAYSGEENITTGYETIGHKFNQWNELTITFAEAHDRLAVRVELAGTGAIEDDKFAQIYFDDLYINKKTQGTYIPDLEKGITFENATDVGCIEVFDGTNGTWWSAHQTQVSLQTFQGSMMLAAKGARPEGNGSNYPTFYVNFGKTYPAGTTLTFNCYYDYERATSGSVMEYTQGSATSIKSHTIPWIGPKQMSTITITLENACDRIAIWTTSYTADSMIYYDNFKLTSPDLVPDISWEELNFETESAMQHVRADDGSYGSGHASTISREEYDGSTRLAVRKNSTASGYPTIHLDLGKEYPAGTTITYWTKRVGGNSENATVVGYKAGQRLNGAATLNDRWLEKNFEYQSKTITLNEACDEIVIFTTETATDAVLYYDNFKVIAPEVVSVLESTGLMFEDESSLEYVSADDGSYGSGHASTISREEYDGSTRLAVRKNSTASGYPTIHLDLGKEYPAGTTITYWTKRVGGNSENATVVGYKAGQRLNGAATLNDRWLEKNFEYQSKTITLNEACDEIVIFTTETATGAVLYYDNFKVTLPNN